MAAEEPRTGAVFRCTIPGLENTIFTEINGLKAERQVVETNTNARGGGPRVLRKAGGNLKYNNLTLKCASTRDRGVWDLFKKQLDGDFKSSLNTFQIEVLDPAKMSPIQVWNVQDAWVQKFQGANMDSQSNEVAKEEVTFAVGRVERVK